MNPNIWRVIAQAAVQVAQIFIERWINTKERSKAR